MTTYDLAMAEYGLIYARVSTDETKQASIPDQITMARRWLEGAGYIVTDDCIFTDEMSRQVWQRPGLQRMLRKIMTDAHVGALCVWQFSRLYYGNEQRLRIYRVLKKHKVRLFDKDGSEENLPGAMNKLVSSLRGVINEFEVDQTSERVHDMHSERAKKSKILQVPVFGIGHTPERGHFINDAQLPTVRLIFQWAADGVPPQEICDRLNAQGVKTIRGAEWRRHNLRRMLRNPIYAGDLVWNRTASYRDDDGKRKALNRNEADWITRPSPLGPLVDRDLFNRAGTAISRRWQRRGGAARGHRKSAERILEGFVYCGRCDSEKRMYPRRTAHKLKDGTRSDWWTFSCASNRHSMSEGKILRLLDRWIQDQETGGVTVVFEPKTDSSAKTEEATIREALAANAEKRKRSVRDREDGTLDDAEFREATVRHRAEKTSLEKRLAEALAVSNAEAPLRLTAEVRAMLAQVVPTLLDESVPMSARRSLMERTLDRLVVDDGRLVVRGAQWLERQDLAS